VSVDHYENFPVASVLCPPALRAPIRAIYWFARTADDIADEGAAGPAERLADLSAFRADLYAVAGGAAPSPRWRSVFEPLAAALRTHRLPVELLADLLSAFQQDVTKDRYADRAEVLDYCRRSANPVGRLLLHLYGITDMAALRRSDAICTALQLANFWQDLSVDLPRGRNYVPESDWQRHGLAPSDLVATTPPPARALLADLVIWTRALMQSGAPLVHTVPGRAGWELRLVVQGGSLILDKVEALGDAAWRTRPALGKADAPRLLWRAVTMRPERAGAVHGATR
jgi:squalene synthase HpnC